MKTDLLAKLLASENIDIIRAGVSTASFDVVNRVLTLPQWQDMTETIELMLKAHEIGHALFSPVELLVNDSKTPKSYVNVIEDVRIERKVKTIFPGLRKDFAQGYKELNERDFFKVANKDLSKMNLINRINLYFKASTSCEVSFSKAEMVFVERAKTCDTVLDVLTLSDDIYAFSKADYEDKKEEREKQEQGESGDSFEGYEEGDSFEGYEEGDDEESEVTDGETEYEPDEDDEESKSEGVGSGDKEEKEKEEALEASTQDAFDDNLDNLADTSLTIVNHVTEIPSEFKSPIVGYKEIIQEITPDYEIAIKDRWYTYDPEAIKKFKTESTNYVNYLVKEFEMKKAAKRYLRTTIAKTGSLNVGKLYAHTISDNLFKSISTVTDEKNHGMIFLLDWSGSMANAMEDTLKQVINLASFCQRSGIAYQVLAFGSQNRRRVDCSTLSKTLVVNDFSLLELFSNKMSTSEFNKMLNLVLTKPWSYSPNYRLGNTPLNSSLLYMVEYIGKFTRANNIEKTSLVVLTDGISTPLFVENSWASKTIHKLSDTVTKKDYVFSIESNEQTQLLLKIIKDRYNIPVIGFYISGTSKREICNFIYTYMNKQYHMMSELQSEIRKTGVHTVTSLAYDELYYLPSSKQTTEVELDINPNSSTSKMAGDFKKFLGRNKKNRIVLDKFIKLVA